ncbi:MAG: MATE family efflux transporter, partial [Phascolarctobacterium sp.]
VYNLVDMVVVGHYIGKIGLSAVAVGGDLQMMLTFLSMGFANAGQVVIAQNIGAGNSHRLGKIVGNLFSFLFFLAAIFSVLSIIMQETLLGWVHTPAEAWEMTSGYMLICSSGLLFIYGYNAVSAILRGMGDSRHPFFFIALAAILNVLLDLLFVVAFELGAQGAALATVLSQGCSCLLGIVFLYRNRRALSLNLDGSCWRWNKATMLPLVHLGIPMALKFASVATSKLFVNSWINTFGIIASGCTGIAAKINLMSNLFSNAINAATSTMVAQNMGAAKYERIPLVLRSAYSVVLVICAVLCLVVYNFPRQVFSIFTTDAEVLNSALLMVPIILLNFLGSATRSPNNGFMDGSGNYKLNLAVAIFDGIINRIGFGLLCGLGLGMGWLGFLLGDAVAGFTPLVIGTLYYCFGSWRTNKHLL